MRRILSLIVALVLILGAANLFAAKAEWSGHYRVKIRSTSVEPDGGDKVSTSYIWQKLEIFPTWKLSKTTAVHAGFFHQQYWGAARMLNVNSGDPMRMDSGGFAGDIATYSYDPLVSESGLKTTLGVSVAYATLNLFGGMLMVDVGRRKNAGWGTGAFFGGGFAPDRIFILAKLKTPLGLLLPYYIYEHRANYDPTDKDDNCIQHLIGALLVNPGKMNIWFVFTYVGTGKNMKRSGNDYGYNLGAAPDDPNYAGNAGQTLTETKHIAMDLFANYKMKMGSISIKPELEIVFGTGVADKEGGLGEVSINTFNILFSFETKIMKMITIIPTFIICLPPSKASDTKSNLSVYGVNNYASNQYTLGLIFDGFPNIIGVKGYGAYGAHEENVGNMVLALEIKPDIIGQFAKGLSMYLKFIYGMVMGDAKDAGTTHKTSEINVMEIDFGVAYKLDPFTTVGLDFGYMKTSDFTAAYGLDVTGEAKPFGPLGYGPKETHMYLGVDLKIKF